jgi:hypothetical protein
MIRRLTESRSGDRNARRHREGSATIDHRNKHILAAVLFNQFSSKTGERRLRQRRRVSSDVTHDRFAFVSLNNITIQIELSHYDQWND